MFFCLFHIYSFSPELVVLERNMTSQCQESVQCQDTLHCIRGTCQCDLMEYWTQAACAKSNISLFTFCLFLRQSYTKKKHILLNIYYHSFREKKKIPQKTITNRNNLKKDYRTRNCSLYINKFVFPKVKTQKY